MATDGRQIVAWKTGCIAFVGLMFVLAFGIGATFVNLYDKSVALEEGVKEKWSEVENQLKGRYDLVPDLIETVKGYAAHEQEVFTEIANARKSYFQARSVGDKARASAGIERALSRLLMLKETYPDLKENLNFLKLQESLEETEKRISVSWTRHEEAVRELNTFVRSFFGRFFAAFAGVKEAENFELPDDLNEKLNAPPAVDSKGE